ncbi:MAG: MATE family efflux transporter [Planctomycetota bacterium]
MAEDHYIEATELPAPEPTPIPEPAARPPTREGPWAELGEVLWLSFPIIITMSSYTAMHFVDVMMVGRYGDAELAAVGPATSFLFLIGSLMMGTLSITNTFVGQSVGRGRRQDAARYAWQGVFIGAVWGIFATCLRPLAPHIFAWAGHAPAVRDLESLYFSYSLFRVPAIGFVYALSAFYQATKRPVVPMVAALIGTIVNIFLNYILIFGKLGAPELGIVGAAVGTVLASYCQAALMFAAFLSGPTHRQYGSRTALEIDLAKAWRMVRLGVPAGLTWCLENASWTLFIVKVIGALGEDALAAQNATIQVIRLSFMPVLGLNIGIQAVVGQHIGMGDHDGAKRRGYRALAAGTGFMVMMGIGFLLFRYRLIGLFTDKASVIELGATMLIFGAIFQAFDAVFIMSYGALKGAGDTRFPMFVTVGSAWLFFLPLAVLLTQVFDLGVAGAWLAMTLYLALAGSITFARFASGAWRKIDIFEGEGEAAE